MILYIKNMVYERCKTVVKNELEALGISITDIRLGEVTLVEKLDAQKMDSISKRLKAHGFEILKDQETKIIEAVKRILIQIVYNETNHQSKNLSDVISTTIQKEYSAISKLFSEIEGTTIEKYLIQLRIERVKELLIYDELSLSEIAFQLNYSSVAYLSNQFKKVTGLSPSFFKKLKEKKRKSIDDL